MLVRSWVWAMVLMPLAAWAHPVAQGRMDVTVHPELVRVRASIALEEICVSNGLYVNEKAAYKFPPHAFDKHGEYLLKHVFVYADGKLLAGKLLKVEPPESSKGELGPEQIQKEYAFYDFEFALPDKAAPPAVVMLKQDVLNEVLYAADNPWQASYVLTVGLHERQAIEGPLLTSIQPFVYVCDWAAPEVKTVTVSGASAPAAAKLDFWGTVKTFMYDGVHHILSGYDHLLFVAALVLAATTLWDLIKVVTAFTVAHSLTLALSTLDIVRLDSAIVEPMIAASIVAVALQNIFWPSTSRGWIRLGAAFFFGLFHGLGFAGGCLEAMEGMAGTTVALAIVSFSIGVELGHQIVVLPLYFALAGVRKAQADDAKRERFQRTTQRYGSVLIAGAGLFYLALSLGFLTPAQPGKAQSPVPAEKVQVHARGALERGAEG